MTITMRSLSFCSLLGFVVFCGHSQAQAEPAEMPKTQWAFANQLALRYNPLGLQEELYLGYKKKLYDAPSSNLLFGKSYVWSGLITRASPQFFQGGGFIQTSPIAVLEINAAFLRTQALTDAGRLPSYYTQGTQDAVKRTASSRSPNGDIIGSGWQASVQGRLQAKVGPIAIRSTHLFRYFELTLEGDRLQQDLFYDQTLDVLTPFKSWVYQNDNDLLYADDNNPWVLGARYTYVSPLTEVTQPEVDADALYSIHRAGLLFAWKFDAPPEDGLEARRRHALIVLSQWHLSHPYRAGQSMNQMIPYFAIVYVLNGRIGSEPE